MQMRMQEGVRKDLFLLISNFYVCTMTPLDVYLNIMF